MATHDDDLNDLDFAMHDHHAEETDGQTLQRLRNRRDAMLRRGDDIRAHDLDAEIEAIERGISVAQARQEMQGEIMIGIDWGTGEPSSTVESTWQDGKLVSVREIAPRPLAISAEEHATRTFLAAMVAAGCELRLLDRTVITVDQAVEHLLEAGRGHTGHTVCIEKDDVYLNINGWLGWL